jgi:hypothetical protein
MQTMAEPRQITQSQLRKEIVPLVPAGINPDEVMEGVVLSLVPRSERKLPLVVNPFKNDVLYAWSEDDASAMKLALNLFGQITQALLAGHAGLLNMGIAVKEVVCFLIDLKRHHVQVDDPLQIKILLLLRDADAGLSAEQVLARLGAGAPQLADIEQALDSLANAEADSGPRPLVRSDRMIWKILV